MAATGPVDCVPLVAFAPLQPSLAVQDVASVVLHVSVEEAPAAITEGVTLSDTVGGGITLTVTLWLTLPPVPVHVSV